MYTEPTQKYLRASEIARDRKTGRPGVLSISLATWWAWVKSGKAPRPIKLSPGVTVWRQTDVIAFAESLGRNAGCPQQVPAVSCATATVDGSPSATRIKRNPVQERLRKLRNQRATRQEGHDGSH
jgi:predicted DNA-binding transcriptional regulator AlpA